MFCKRCLAAQQNRMKRKILYLISALTIITASRSLAFAVDSVTIKNVNNIYYQVDIDFTKASHYDVGQQYARAIKANIPDYEKRIDSFLNFMGQKLGLDIATLRARALDISRNIPPEYMEEIKGLQSVFSYNKDKLGDGRLSCNELLVFEIFGDVGRLSGCSAAAVFGNSSSTGKTILARNLEWVELPNSELQAIQAVVTLKNKDKTLTSFTFLGDIAFISAVSSDKIFAALLDVITKKPYPPAEGKRSYMMDLRYAMENNSSLKGVADYMSSKDYAYSHLIFLADADSAYVLENDIGSPARGLRGAGSALQSGIIWNYPDAIAVVNSFMLPGNAETFTGNNNLNVDRWNSFLYLFGKFLYGGAKLDIEGMKYIAGYPGRDGTYKTGALFRPGDHYPSLHLIVMRMDTLETWAAFAPVGAPPAKPTYIKLPKIVSGAI